MYLKYSRKRKYYTKIYLKYRYKIFQCILNSILNTCIKYITGNNATANLLVEHHSVWAILHFTPNAGVLYTMLSIGTIFLHHDGHHGTVLHREWNPGTWVSKKPGFGGIFKPANQGLYVVKNPGFDGFDFLAFSAICKSLVQAKLLSLNRIS